MASIRHIRRARVKYAKRGRQYVRRKVELWRVAYKIWLPDGSSVDRTREAASRSRARLLVHDAERLEELSVRGMLSVQDAVRFRALGLLGEEEARAWLGLVPAISWDEVLRRYEEGAGRTPETRRENLGRARRLAQWFIAQNLQPSSVTQEHIRRWRAERRGRADSTIHNDLVVLARMLDAVFDRARHPVRNGDRVAAPKTARLPRALTPEEDEALLAAVRDRAHLLRGYLWPLYLVYRGAGLRRAEALTLPWAHVLEDRILIQRVDADGSTWLPKGKAARAVVFPDWNRWMLDELSQGRSPRRTVVPQVNEDAVSRTFVKIMGTIADGLTLHSLRHTAITELLERGWPVARVRVWAGHQHLATTERYTHVAVEHRIRRLFEAYREIT